MRLDAESLMAMRAALLELAHAVVDDELNKVRARLGVRAMDAHQGKQRAPGSTGGERAPTTKTATRPTGGARRTRAPRTAVKAEQALNGARPVAAEKGGPPAPRRAAKIAAATVLAAETPGPACSDCGAAPPGPGRTGTRCRDCHGKMISARLASQRSATGRAVAGGRASSAARRARAKALSGDGPWSCDECGVQVSTKKATQHSWDAHGKAVPAGDIARHFEPVKEAA